MSPLMHKFLPQIRYTQIFQYRPKTRVQFIICTPDVRSGELYNLLVHSRIQQTNLISLKESNWVPRNTTRKEYSAFKKGVELAPCLILLFMDQNGSSEGGTTRKCHDCVKGAVFRYIILQVMKSLSTACGRTFIGICESLRIYRDES